MTAYCVTAGGCLCRCRNPQTKTGCATGQHCGVHGRKCHLTCRARQPGQPPRRDGIGWGAELLSEVATLALMAAPVVLLLALGVWWAP